MMRAYFSRRWNSKLDNQGLNAVAISLVIVLLAIVINGIKGTTPITALGLDGSFLISGTIVLALASALVGAVTSIVLSVGELVDKVKTAIK